MTSTSNTIRFAAALTLGAALLGGCTHSPSRSQVTWQDNGTPHTNHQNQQWWNYQFVYFPASQVYFEPYSKNFYWFEQGVWRQGTELPNHITLQNESPTVVKLAQEQPYLQHHSVTSEWMTSNAPIPGSDFTKTPQTFAAYLNRYQTAQLDYQRQQWALNGNTGPVGSPFNPFSSPMHSFWGTGSGNSTTGFASTTTTSPWNSTANAGTNNNNSEYVNGSKEYHNAKNSWLNTSTAEAASDQPQN